MWRHRRCVRRPLVRGARGQVLVSLALEIVLDAGDGAHDAIGNFGESVIVGVCELGEKAQARRGVPLPKFLFTQPRFVLDVRRRSTIDRVLERRALDGKIGRAGQTQPQGVRGVYDVCEKQA